MSIARIKKRQEDKGIKLFNKLFVEFTNFLNKNSEEFEGFLYVDEEVNVIYDEYNNAWRRFVNNHRKNAKRKTDFALYAFEEKARNYLNTLEKQVWKKYMLQFMPERYGIDTDYDELEKYYKEEKKPNEAGVEMVMDIPTINEQYAFN